MHDYPLWRYLPPNLTTLNAKVVDKTPKVDCHPNTFQRLPYLSTISSYEQKALNTWNLPPTLTRCRLELTAIGHQEMDLSNLPHLALSNLPQTAFLNTIRRRYDCYSGPNAFNAGGLADAQFRP